VAKQLMKICLCFVESVIDHITPSVFNQKSKIFPNIGNVNIASNVNNVVRTSILMKMTLRMEFISLLMITSSLKISPCATIVDKMSIKNKIAAFVLKKQQQI